MMPLEILQNILRRIDRLIVLFIIRPFGLLRPKSTSDRPSKSNHHVVLPSPIMRPLFDFQQEVSSLFTTPCNVQQMQYMSQCLKKEYVKKLQTGDACMLPSFCHTLPTGQECGTFIALDIGGSTFRVALIELASRSKSAEAMLIKRMSINKIDEDIRHLPAPQFFAWIATKIRSVLSQSDNLNLAQDQLIPVGLAWSFPIEQTSYKGGNVQRMGKGFKCHEGVLGQDLGSLIESACLEQGLHVRVDAIVNDSSATLLSQAYMDSSTSMGLILGTGMNAAVCLPVKDLGPKKFGARHPSWFTDAEKVLINTEVSMFGKDILPKTRWDEQLNCEHPLPDFQPLEYMTTGRYLGEIFRLVLVEAVETCHLFGGVMPESLHKRYSLDTAILAAIQEDSSAGYISSAERIQKEFRLLSTPSLAEMSFLRTAVESISQRAAAYTATAVHSLWSLEHDEQDVDSRLSVAANGSVILKYPGFRQRCQDYLADIITANQMSQGLTSKHELVIQSTDEATLLGVAVAVAIAGA